MIALPRHLAMTVGSAALALWLSACATPPALWQKPNAGTNEQRATLDQCRSNATKEIERDYRRDQIYRGNDNYGGQSTYQKNMDAFQVKKNSTNLLARCMTLNGYRRVQ